METPTKTTVAPPVEPERKEEKPVEPPQAFYARLVKRTDMREILR
jgi:hypothetical protein